MSYAPSIVDICTRALRKIGVYAIRSSGPRPEEIEEARYWLDMLVGHLVGKKRTWWRVPRTASITLTSGVKEYDLVVALGTAAPDGVEFVIGAQLLDATGQRLHDINILGRQEYEGLIANPPGLSTEPQRCYISRDQKPTLFFVEAPDDTQVYTVRLLFQSYAPNMVTGRGNTRIEEIGFRSSYTLYLVTALAAQIGDGPVRKAPADEVKKMQADARALLVDLESYEDMEQQGGDGRVAYYGGI
jgi:hypothetical protein